MSSKAAGATKVTTRSSPSVPARNDATQDSTTGTLRSYGRSEVRFAAGKLGRPTGIGPLELFSPSTFRRTARGWWALYPMGTTSAALVHPEGAMTGTTQELAGALRALLGDGQRRHREDQQAIETLLPFLQA